MVRFSPLLRKRLPNLRVRRRHPLAPRPFRINFASPEFVKPTAVRPGFSGQSPIFTTPQPTDMTSGEEKKPALFTEFAPVSEEKWREVILKDLKGADPKSLHWSTDEGITVKPFYTREDLDQVSNSNRFTFVGGGRGSRNHFLNIQPIRVTGADGREAIDKAVRALTQGADGVHFIISDPGDFPLERLVRHLNLAQTPVSFTVLKQRDELVSALLAKVQENGTPPESLSGFVQEAAASDLPQPLEQADFARLAKLVRQTETAGGLRVVTVDGAAFRNHGSTAGQEIAFALSGAVHYLHALTEGSLPLEAVVRRLQVLLSVGPDYFFEIAKFRALRLLWAAVLRAYGAAELAPHLRVHASTSRWHQTTLDPHTNLLRATTEAMAAILGGCDSLAVEPFDSTYESPTPFAERLARNIPLLLREEAYLDQTVDPAGGSFYLESLTEQLARQAWALFQEVESLGGYGEAFRAGFVQEQISRASREKHARIATGKDVIVGTNRYPNLQEELPFDPEQLLQSREFVTTRGAYPFEVMRLAAELHHRKRKRRPLAAIAVLGASIERHVNASFAREFFACANFQTETQAFETVQTAAAALLSQPAAVIVLSSSPEDFAQFGREFGPLLRNHPHKPTLILASDPKVMKEEMIASGFEEFIFDGCDTKTIIARIQDKLMQEEE
jgi:methylmalonyl-CoA mutase